MRDIAIHRPFLQPLLLLQLVPLFPVLRDVGSGLRRTVLRPGALKAKVVADDRPLAFPGIQLPANIEWFARSFLWVQTRVDGELRDHVLRGLVVLGYPRFRVPWESTFGAGAFDGAEKSKIESKSLSEAVGIVVWDEANLERGILDAWKLRHKTGFLQCCLVAPRTIPIFSPFPIVLDSRSDCSRKAG